MNILAIDSASESESVSVVSGGNILAESFSNTGLTHSETLLPMILETVQKSGLEMKEITRVAVSNGPGSFTGLRIGVSTALGIARAVGAECVGVSSLAAMAYGAQCGDGLICAVLDARNQQVYCSLFERRENITIRLTEDRALTISGLLDEIGERNTYLVGDDIKGLDGVFRKKKDNRGLGAALCATSVEARPAQPLEYIKKPQAERELENKMREG